MRFRRAPVIPFSGVHSHFYMPEAPVALIQPFEDVEINRSAASSPLAAIRSSAAVHPTVMRMFSRVAVPAVISQPVGL